MTEAGVDVIVPIMSELKGDSRLVVLIGSPEGITRTSKKIITLHGVKKIRRGLFIIQGYSGNHDEILHSQSFISFNKTREIPTLRSKLEDVYSNRAYTIVSFSFNNPTAKQKKCVERLIRKTTGIRLRPGVVLFPLLRSKERRRILGPEDERELLDSNEFNRLVRETGGNSERWSRLKITTPVGAKIIEHAIEQTHFRDMSSLEKNIRTLRERCKDPTVTISQLKNNYTTLSRRFRELKIKWILAKKLWFYNTEKTLKRTYNMMINTRRAIITEETRRVG